jgi:DHA1 family bicyclomycin/chloramphenicol resistance-like MFS transporter
MTSSHHRIAAILGALVALGPLSIDMYLPAFPELARAFRTDAASVQITLAAYFVGLAIGQGFYGALSDRVGRKAPLYAGLTIFVLASLGCALAATIEMLIALRFVQALGGCAAMVISRAVVRDRFDERDSARVLSMLMLVMGVAPILAPLAGGWLVVHRGWQAIFFVLASIGVLNLLMVWLTLGESLPIERRHRHDFVAVLRVYRALLGDRHFMRFALGGGLTIAGMFAYIAGSPYVFMEIYGVLPENYGWIFGTNAAGLIAASQVNGRLVMRLQRERMLATALGVGAVAGVVLLAAGLTGIGGLMGILLPLFVFVAGLGFVLPLSTALAMAPHGRNAGSASALLGVLQFVLGAVAGSLVGALHDGTARPMTIIIAACACASLLVLFALGRPAGAAPR